MESLYPKNPYDYDLVVFERERNELAAHDGDLNNPERERLRLVEKYLHAIHETLRHLPLVRRAQSEQVGWIIYQDGQKFRAEPRSKRRKENP